MQCPACNATLSDDLRYCVQCGQHLDEATVVLEKPVSTPPSRTLTKNQKLAIGCGGGGCLLLIVVAIVAVAVYFIWERTPGSNYNRSNYNLNSNNNRSANDNSNNANSEPSSSSSMSDDNRHRLFQAAAATHDQELIKRVNRKLGLLDKNDVPGQKYTEFVRDHIGWIFRNTDWLREVDTAEKGRAYVEKHIND
jgi:hypothetical protein